MLQLNVCMCVDRGIHRQESETRNNNKFPFSLSTTWSTLVRLTSSDTEQRTRITERVAQLALFFSNSAKLRWLNDNSRSTQIASDKDYCVIQVSQSVFKLSCLAETGSWNTLVLCIYLFCYVTQREHSDALTKLSTYVRVSLVLYYLREWVALHEPHMQQRFSIWNAKVQSPNISRTPTLSQNTARVRALYTPSLKLAFDSIPGLSCSHNEHKLGRHT